MSADHHHHHHHHGHAHLNGLGRLAAEALGRRQVHRIGRRQFVTDLGRRTFALAIIGAGVAACSDDSDAGGSAAGSSSSTTAGSTTPSSTTEPTTEPPSTSTSDDAEPADTEPDDGAGPSLQWSQVSLGFVSAYVLVRGNEAAVVDTGNPGSVGDIADALANLGSDFGAVGHVVLTHRHPDHVGSLADVLSEAPNAVAYAGDDDIPNITSPNPLQPVGDGDEVFGLEVLDTPGHTPGSISVLDTDIGLLIAGDALNGNNTGTAITGANPDFSSDMGVADESLRKLASRQFEIAAFGHGNPVEGGAGDLVAALAADL